MGRGRKGALGALLRGVSPGAWMRFARDLRDHLGFVRTANAVRGLYPDFAAAARAAPRGRTIGYDTARHAEMYDHRLERLLIGDYPTLFWFSRLLPEVST